MLRRLPYYLYMASLLASESVRGRAQCHTPADSPFRNVTNPTLVRNVAGANTRTNDLITAGSRDSNKAVVYFGGDIQDLEEAMIASGCVPYLQWSLERTAAILANKFPEHVIVVVRPKRKQDLVFSCFDNFVRSTPDMSPSEYDPHYGASEHLDRLLHSVQNSLGNHENEIEELYLVGFSKGCVVLNQLLTEALGLKNENISLPILSKLRRMYYLDSGHSSSVDYWVTDEKVVSAFKNVTALDAVHIVNTRYQMEQPSRPKYKPQLGTFKDVCGRLGIPVDFTLLFEDERSRDKTIAIEEHFQVLNLFIP